MRFYLDPQKLKFAAIGLIIVVVIVLLFTVYREIPKEDYPLAEVEISSIVIPQVSTVTDGKPSNVTISDSFRLKGTVLNRADIYRYQSQSYFTDPRIENITRTLGVGNIQEREDPVLGHTLFATSINKALYIYEGRQEMVYDNYASTTPPQNDRPFTQAGIRYSIDEAASLGQSYLESLGIDTTRYQLTGQNYMTVSENHLETVIHPTTANLLALRYEAKINGIPIITKKDTLASNSIELWFNEDKNLAKISFYPIGEIGGSLGRYRLKNIEEIRSSVNNNEGVLVNGSFLPNDKIKGLTIVEGWLAYFNYGDYLIPVYVLTGGVQIERDDNIEVGYMIIEAIRE